MWDWYSSLENNTRNTTKENIKKAGSEPLPFTATQSSRIIRDQFVPTLFVKRGYLLSGPSWARTSDPLIMSFLYSMYYSDRISQDN